jgi:hypothetical protein
LWGEELDRENVLQVATTGIHRQQLKSVTKTKPFKIKQELKGVVSIQTGYFQYSKLTASMA